MSDGKRNPGKRTSGLLGDLESIRALLEEPEPDSEAARDATPAPDPAAVPAAEPTDSAAEPADSDEDVPLLEDVVQGGVSVSETFFSGEGTFGDSAPSSGLNDEIFKALLSDEWRESARELLDQAREAIEQHQTEWTPEHTDELNAALKVRIDETVQHWLRDVVASRVDDLRQALLAALSDQIRITINEQFDQAADEDPDGA